jgi:membrane-associated phospholipid phosphatase
MVTKAALAAVCALACAAPRALHAQQSHPSDEADFVVDGAITAGLLTGMALASFIPVDTSTRWDRQLFGSLDDSVKDNFSASAAERSDGLLTLSMVAPALLQLPRGLDESTGRRLLLYSETLAASMFLHGVAKYVVQRPRPYNYNPDQRVQDYAAAEGDDSHLSFYSGHAATAFAAAVGGSYLFSLGPNDEKAKAVVWLLQVGLATTTAGLRVRAGKHFYSDVTVGALSGSAVGILVPALHAGASGMRMPTSIEWGGMAGGLILGTVATWLLPLDSDVIAPLEDPGSAMSAPAAATRPAMLWYGSQF